MATNFTDFIRGDGKAHEIDPHMSTFRDLLDLIREPAGVLTKDEHQNLINYVRFLLGLPQLDFTLDEDEEDVEIVHDLDDDGRYGNE